MQLADMVKDPKSFIGSIDHVDPVWIDWITEQGEWDSVISEVVAMNHLLKFSGVNSAAAFDQKLRQYLEQDYE